MPPLFYCLGAYLVFLLHGLAVNQLCLILYLSKTAFSFFFSLIILFIYFWLCWVSVAVKAFSLVAASGSYSLVMVCCLLIFVVSLIGERSLSCSEACGIFLDQGFNPCLLHWPLYSLLLSHHGSPNLLSWVIINLEESPTLFLFYSTQMGLTIYSPTLSHSESPRDWQNGLKTTLCMCVCACVCGGGVVVWGHLIFGEIHSLNRGAVK